MSSTVRVVTVDGEDSIMTLAGLRRAMNDEESYVKALTALMRDGSAPVTLGNGVPAMVADDKTKISLAPPQRALALRLFDMSLTMLIPVQAHITCNADSATEAVRQAKDVLEDQQPPPPGFQIEISQDDIDCMLSSLDMTLPANPHWIRPAGITVTHVNERQMLGGPAS